MALVKEVLKGEIKTAYDAISGNEKADPDTARDQLADAIATAIDNYLKSAQVVGTSPSGPVTGNLI